MAFNFSHIARFAVDPSMKLATGSRLPRAEKGRLIAKSLGMLLWLSALGVMGCASDSSDMDTGVPYMLTVSRYAPTSSSPDERLMLLIGPKGTYEVLHAQNQPRSETLSSARIEALRAHTTAAAAAELMKSAEDSFDRCEKQSDAYAIDVGDERGASRTGLLCLVPEKVTGEAKQHLDHYVALFAELTASE